MSSPDRTVDPDILKEYIEGESGLSFRRNSVSWIFSCPRCDKKDKLYIRRRDGKFICFFCAEIHGYRGKYPDAALADLTGETLDTIRQRLYGDDIAPPDALADFSFHGFFNPAPRIEREDFGPEPMWWPFNHFELTHKKAARGLAYLESRGIPLEVGLRYHLRYAPEEMRVVFPVELEGALYGYQKRYILPTTGVVDDEPYEIPKILSSTDLPREHMLMFADRIEEGGHCVLAEGPVDAIKADLCGGNVAAMGKAVTRGQLAIIRERKVRKVYLALDPDAAEEMMRLIRELEGEMEVYEMMATGNGAKPDLGAMDYRDVYELFRGAARVDSRKLYLFLPGVG